MSRNELFLSTFATKAGDRYALQSSHQPNNRVLRVKTVIFKPAARDS